MEELQSDLIKPVTKEPHRVWYVRIKVHVAILKYKPKENVRLFLFVCLSQRTGKSIYPLRQYTLITEFWRWTHQTWQNFRVSRIGVCTLFCETAEIEAKNCHQWYKAGHNVKIYTDFKVVRYLYIWIFLFRKTAHFRSNYVLFKTAFILI